MKKRYITGALCVVSIAVFHLAPVVYLVDYPSLTAENITQQWTNFSKGMQQGVGAFGGHGSHVTNFINGVTRYMIGLQPPAPPPRSNGWFSSAAPTPVVQASSGFFSFSTLNRDMMLFTPLLTDRCTGDNKGLFCYSIIGLQFFMLFTLIWNAVYIAAWSLHAFHKFFLMRGKNLKERYGANSYAVITG